MIGAMQLVQILGGSIVTNYKLDTDTHVFFYEQDYYVLSNFSSFKIFWANKWFDTTEQAYHWEKFTEAPDVQALIYDAKSAHDAFKIAQENKSHADKNWNQIKASVMKGLLRAKAKQHPYVTKKLLATGDRTLVEDSWRDDVWGWGPNKDGQNLLGKLWMEVRAELRSENA
jgi:ribA/ribD-fused uncharacterized protein